MAIRPEKITVCFAVFAALVLSGCDETVQPASGAFTRTGEIIAYGGGDGGAQHACFTCHGLSGAGDGALAPRLAALDLGYLHRQLDDYADGRRRHDAMAKVAGKLKPDDRGKVAAYYAALPIASTSGPANLPGSRHPLYDYGDVTRGLAPCASCHGQDGESGVPAVPPLAGQSAAYIAEQLRAWKRGDRQNDPGHVMLKISQSLTPAEIDALSAFAASLSGVLRQQAKATSLPARRDDPRNGALARPPHGPE